MKKKIIYSGKILGLSIYYTKVNGRKIVREMVEHRGASAVLAFDEDNQVILVKQHRFGHGFVLEIPAGTLEKHETPRKCAQREIQEETGYKASRLEHLITYFPSIGYNKEAIHCFVARGLKKISNQTLDEDEIMSVVKTDFNKLIKMIKSGKIIDSKTICAALVYAAKKNQL